MLHLRPEGVDHGFDLQLKTYGRIILKIKTVHPVNGQAVFLGLGLGHRQPKKQIGQCGIIIQSFVSG
ncbi:hypothetical protein SDC9_193721 [bioreactor metagenome]|uniref:Uncharacterized protein n=1 Tax=bioreactor metagenome TaxID=1076179 RepID=A0A645I4F8_9ZZZZ